MRRGILRHKLGSLIALELVHQTQEQRTRPQTLARGLLDQPHVFLQRARASITEQAASALSCAGHGVSTKLGLHAGRFRPYVQAISLTERLGKRRQVGS